LAATGKCHCPESQKCAATGNGIYDARKKAGREKQKNDKNGHGPSQGSHAIKAKFDPDNRLDKRAEDKILSQKG